MKEKMKKRQILMAILFLGLFLIAGCSQQAIEGDGDGGEEIQLTGEVKEFDIVAKNWEFVPNTIEVNLGDKVELHIESVEGTHGFMLPDFGINERLEPYQDVHVDFIADKKGTFTFACSVPCGSGHGRMKGTLVVK